MSAADPPIGADAQRLVARQWESAQAGRPGLVDVRGLVRDSWARSLLARVRQDLSSAPVVWREDDVRAARERLEWVEAALRVAAAQGGAYAAGGSVLTLFDRAGRMLHSEGDARALEGLGAINFRPGSLWAEQTVGTNGPGTALATGEPVHIVGAEHFSERWHGWHCAAVPIRDPLTGEIQGAVDVSGFADTAHPYTLALVRAIAVAVEQMLGAREMERRVRVLRQFGDLAARWPGDPVVAVDRGGTVLGASPSAPVELHPVATLGDELRLALARAVTEAASAVPREVQLPAGVGAAVVYPVLDDRTPVGACLVIPRAARHRPSAAPADRARPGAGTARLAGSTGSTRYGLGDLVGGMPALWEAHRIAIAAAANTLPVLLLGETGTGKEMFAQGIHAASRRAAAPFVAVNCAAIPSELLESELFGYVGGAFSGARREGRTGKFEAANGGTLFLDEIGELPLPAQAALLRVLQERELTRVGSTLSVPVDVRIIAATNRGADPAGRIGTLRDDLFHRLNVLTIELPPLRERRADVHDLAHHFLAEAEAELQRTGHVFAPEVLDAFRLHPWPGNVRELRNLVWRTVALTAHPRITLADLPPAFRAALPAVGCPPRLPAPAPPLESPPGADAEWRAGRERVARAVELASSMAEAAEILGIARSTLYRQLEKYRLQPRRVLRED
jgi:sigma-54 dependent transcriptional regulator, acetoin dehydrogenase operon transcriptional activator AcoR